MKKWFVVIAVLLSCTALLPGRGLAASGAGAKAGSPLAGAPTDWATVAAGQYHTVAVKNDGTLWAWGYNGYGQLGDGTTVNRNVATQIGTDTNWKSVSAGYVHTVALKTDGTLWAWGYNGDGELGDNTLVDKHTPVKIGTDTDWKTVSAGYYHTMALKNSGALWGWGYNFYGQLGDTTTTDRNVPVPIGTGWTSMSAGGYHTEAIKSNGTLWGWGYNYFGRLGDGTTTDRHEPTPVGTDTNWASVSAGEFHSMAIKTDHTLWGWGFNGSGRLGIIIVGNSFATAPTQVGTDFDWVSVAAGRAHTLAIKTDQSLWTWGYNFDGQLGNGASGASADLLVPTRIGQTSNWAAAAVGGFHSCAITTTGALSTWGVNQYGQLGSGTSGLEQSRTAPTRIGSATWQSISAGQYHTVAVDSGGQLWAWGYNAYGQLGDDTTVNRTSPTRIGTATNWESVSAGYFHTVAVKTDGTLWAWGYNSTGQLGDGTTTDRHAPLQIGSATTWASVSAGYYHTMALRTNNTLWGWGRNAFNQLGDTTTDDRHEPTQIGSAATWATVSAGGLHTLALGTDHTLWGWGFNNHGQVGNGGADAVIAPVKIGTATDWASVSAGGYHSVAGKSGGTLWAWGYNEFGQLGDGTYGTAADKNVPLQIESATNWSFLSAGYVHSMGIKADNSLWGWGHNRFSQLGNGIDVDVYAPVRIGTDADWKTVSSGEYFTFALKTDNSLWGWGDNFYGQLGTGSSGLEQNRITPGSLRYPLSVGSAGTGNGSVSGNGISCDWNGALNSGICSGIYDYNTQFILTETPGSCSFFRGWSSACSGNSTTCTMTISGVKGVAVDFDLYPQVWFASIQAGYDTLTAAYANTAGGVIHIQSQNFPEELVLNRQVDVAFDSGWNCTYTAYDGDVFIRSLSVEEGSLALQGDNAVVIGP